METNQRISLWTYIVSAFTWSCMIGVTVVVTSLTTIFVGPLLWVNKRFANHLAHRTAILWAKGIFFSVPFWKVYISGLENIDPKKHYVITANHQSIVDILAALATLPIQFRFVAKKELFKVPCLGWHMAVAGYIPVDREDVNSRKAAVTRSLGQLRDHVSILMFPEGTRSMTGEIQKFKPGAFKLAQAVDVEILPVVIDGTCEAIPKKSWIIRKNVHFSVRVHKPVPLKPELSLVENMAAIRQFMIDDLAHIREKRLAGCYD